MLCVKLDSRAVVKACSSYDVTRANGRLVLLRNGMILCAKKREINRSFLLTIAGMRVDVGVGIRIMSYVTKVRYPCWIVYRACGYAVMPL